MYIYPRLGTHTQDEKMFISREASPIFPNLNCVFMYKKAKFPSTYQYFSGMSFPKSPFFLTMHSHTMVFAKCTPFAPLFSGALSPEDLILYRKFRNFYHQSPKDPIFVLKHAKFLHVTKRPHFHWKLPHFCHQKTIHFLSHRKTPFYMHDVSHFLQIESCASGISPPPFSPSQRLSLPLRSCLIIFSLTFRSIMQGQRLSGKRWAICTQSLPRQLYAILSCVRMTHA